ncbi:MAG: threonine dehydrogenase [Rhodoglobus sp.]|nr:threonine dehydrogenase [Rhodoglobus sp.]
MLTAAYVGASAIEIREAEPIPPGPGEVQIRVAYVGLCCNDAKILMGEMDAQVHLPLVLGHEMSGTIEAVGAGVEEWSVGDAVTVMPLTWDGTCPACLAGNTHICQNLDLVGVDSPGALQSLWTVSAKLLVAIPAGTPLTTAALVEPVAAAVHDVRRSELKAGNKVVILGAGPVGALIATVVREFGADAVVVEPDPPRRARVGELGFVTLDPAATDLTAWVDQWTAGAGADIVFEVYGSADAVLAAADLAKVRGTIVFVTTHGAPHEVNLERVFRRELRILGARVYQRTDFYAALELLARGAIPTEQLVTQIDPLSGILAAIDELEAGRLLKVLVDVQGR